MPVKDKYHERLKIALSHDRWHIVKEQVLITVGKRHLWIDIKAERDNRVVYIEVKGFETTQSIVNYLYASVGQYIAYLGAIEHHQLGIPLYLAVPEEAAQGILSEEIGQIVMQQASISLLIFDSERAEILRWSPLQT